MTGHPAVTLPNLILSMAGENFKQLKNSVWLAENAYSANFTNKSTRGNRGGGG